MMRAFLSLAAVTLLVLPASSAAQDTSSLTGAWTLSFTSSQGSVNLPVELRQDGTTLNGTSGSALGFETDFETGKVDGATFSFDVFVEVEGEWYPIGFTGRMEGGELTGNVNIPGGTRATFKGTRATPG